MTDNWGNDPIVTKDAPGSDWGDDPIVVGGTKAPASSAGATKSAPPIDSDSVGAALRGKFGGAGIREARQAAEVPETGPTWREATAKLDALQKAGVPQTDPRYQQALKDRSQAFSRVSTGTPGELGAAMLGGPIMERGVEALRAIPGAARGVGAVTKRLLPSAEKEAQQAVTQIGAATGKSDLGAKMYRDLKARIDKLLSARSKAEREGRAAYTAQGIAKERDIAKQFSDRLAQLSSEHPHPAEQKILEGTANNLLQDRSLHSLVLEKRRLADIAGGKLEGFDSNQKVLAGKLSDELSRVIQKNAPAYGDYLKKYAEMSHDINLFEDTTLGKRITNEASEFLPDVPTNDPAKIPGTFFSTKHSVAMLRQLSGGNEKFVSEAAGEHAATQLADLNATQARAWVRKNQDWLEAVPSVQRDVDRYVSNLEKVSHTQERAAKIAAAAGKVGVGGAAAGGSYLGLKHFFGW